MEERRFNGNPAFFDVYCGCFANVGLELVGMDRTGVKTVYIIKDPSIKENKTKVLNGCNGEKYIIERGK